jgi:ATP-dependent DNA helicase RecG
VQHIEGYREQDPMRRAASLRAALAVLNEIGDGQPTSASQSASAVETIRPAAARATPVRETGSEKPAATKPEVTQKRLKLPVSKSNGNVPAPQIQRTVTPSEPPALPSYNPIKLEAGMTQGHTALALLSADITAVPNVGNAAAARLRHLGIRAIRDLLFYFPREHLDYSKLLKLHELPFGQVVTTMGILWDVETRRTKGGRTITIATISDEKNKLYASWFNQSYLQKQLSAAKGHSIIVTGIKTRFGNKVEFSVRSHELPDFKDDMLNTGRLVPVYALTEGLSIKALRRYTKFVVDKYAAMIPEHLPASVIDAARLLPLPDAIAHIHYPENEELLAAARRRLAFDELFMIQLGMQERRSRWQQGAPSTNAFQVDLSRIFIHPPALADGSGAEQPPALANVPALIPPSPTLWANELFTPEKPFEGTLPFTFTAAQSRVISEILGDLGKSKPMCRLLQGDVGAGKTAVAAAALFMAALNGYQGAIMAPTEILAEQHAHGISTMLEPFGIRTVLLTGSQRSRERTMGRQALESGQATVAIGTHALIQDDVTFQRLGLVIVDEQHRFGVEQRDALRLKGYHPHMLVMTATPIPRTLALTLYGDLDISAIDQLPPGRQKIITRWRTGARRTEANSIIAQQVAEGRQAFIICPLIEESETLQVKAATSEYERLQREVFPELRLGLLHGGMKSVEKDQTMRRFRDHELDILVATSVIEVGIDVPNATVMVIEDADRFGLSQLHQFRGRVGRGKHQSFCYVLSADASIQSQERLGVFQDIDDGFRLSEEDLRLRGPGDFVGVRQSGMPELRIADLSDTQLIELTRRAAARLWESDPYLRKPEHSSLRERVHLFWQHFAVH